MQATSYAKERRVAEGARRGGGPAYSCCPRNGGWREEGYDAYMQAHTTSLMARNGNRIGQGPNYEDELS